MKYVIFILAPTSTLAFAEEIPTCRATLNDNVNSVISELSWKQEFFTGYLKGASNSVLITTSLGADKIMSLWVREKTENAAGMFSFVDLASGREQYMRFYMADGFSVGVNCKL